MSKAKAITRVHTRSRQEHLIRIPGSKRYVRANSPEIVRGEQGTKSENIRGQYSSPDLRDTVNDPQIRARAWGRRNKLTATVASLKKA